MLKSEKIRNQTTKAWRLISFEKIFDERGQLTVLEGKDHLPFKVRRLFYVNNPSGVRGNHAHKTLIELLIPMSGSLTVEVEDGHNIQSFELSPNGTGLLTAHDLARSIASRDCTYLVLASNGYAVRLHTRSS